jgi:hypothetical protein
MATTFTKIASVSVGSGGSSSISFTSIPSTYTDLVLKVSLREATANNGVAKLKFNSSATSYTARLLWGNGSSFGSSTNYTGGGTYYGTDGSSNGSSNTVNSFASAEYYVPNYAGSNFKSISFDGGAETNATAIFLGLSAGLWSNTAAITSIDITEFSGTNWAQYSTATLYGIKKN